MVNPFLEVNWQPDLKERRRFAASLIIGCPCVAAVLLVAERWRGTGWHWDVPLTVGGVGLALGLVVWIAPQIARPFYVGWYGVSCSIGFVIGNAVLAAVYFLMFAPVGLVMRAIGRTPLSKKFDRSAPSYWRDEPTPNDPERYFRQF